MDLNAGLWQQQSLKLSMTQELSQAIALLQFSSLELVDFLEDKMLDNPLLQMKNQKIELYSPKKKRTANDKDWMEQIGDQRFTLADHLLSQMHDIHLTSIQKKIITYMIHHLDDNGYFTGNLREMAVQFTLPHTELEECLSILQQLEPAGIAARNLGECLLLQVMRQPEDRRLTKEILSTHFQMFANKKWKALAKMFSIEMTEIQKIFDYVQTLNPRPGLAFQYERAPYIIPDVVIELDGEQILVSLYDDLLSKVQFNQQYFQKMTTYQDQKVSAFLQEKRQDYQWIIRSIEQRQRTIIHVTNKIVEKQQDYFQRGAAFLKPMTMKEVAEELGIHESTVSRTVREKYAQTPFGTVELKTFFTSAIESVTDESLSSSMVKNAINKLVNGEDKQKPLSDQDMVYLLKKEEGIKVSRRTVAKYREQLVIPSSSKRKRYE